MIQLNEKEEHEDFPMYPIGRQPLTVFEPKNNTPRKLRGYPVEVRTTPKIGRNDKCSCKSGLKYKKCCLALDLREYE